MAGAAPRDPHTLDAPAADEKPARLVAENFLTDIIDRDVAKGTYPKIVTRFPPEPNGYAHIGHAVASYINFGLAHDYGGSTRLRLDDTNPLTERLEYAEGIIRDMAWLGWTWAGDVSYASNYFDELYGMAQRLVRAGKAYVDSVDEEEMSRLRGTATSPGTPSPYRDRSVQENLELLECMKAGEFPNGAHVLRAKIDLTNNNMKLRDPVLYRIVNAPHYRTGDAWHIYPSYDFAQAPSDALDGVTHSLCSLEFTDNRAVYDWLMDNLWDGPRPRQVEFGRRSLEYTVVSKRKLIELVNRGAVTGWDDPRMPTLAGLRRRGVRPEAIRDFAGRVGLSRTNRTVDLALLEYAVRTDLNPISPRVMAVLDPLKVTLTNYDGEGETIDAPYWPHDIPKEGSRPLLLGRELYIDRSDFQETPERGFRRLSPGSRVRLRHAFVIRCDEVVKDKTGAITELRCTFEPEGNSDPRGVIHWVAADGAVPAEFRLYDRLFSVPNPEEDDVPFTDKLNPDSLTVKRGFVEPSALGGAPDTRYQFERTGFFIQDAVDSRPDALVFNRIIELNVTHKGKAQHGTDAEVAARGERRKSRHPKAEISPEPERNVTDGFAADEAARFESLGKAGANREEAAVLARDEALANYFSAARALTESRQLAGWVVSEIARDRNAETVPPPNLAELIGLVEDGTLSTRLAKEVFAEMAETGRGAREIVAARGLEQVSDAGALEAVIDRLIAQNPDKASAYRGGKTGLLGFFVGQLMRETNGQANPQLAQDLVKRKLQSA